MVNKSDDKTRLFNRQAENFRLVKESLPNLEISPDISNHEICPICLKRISLTLDQLDSATMEHAPSAKLGGRIIGLTCKNCNSTQGSSLDSKLIKYYKVSQTLAGDSQDYGEAKIRVNNSLPINVKFRISEDSSWRIIPIEKNSNPIVVKNINQILQNNNSPHSNLSMNIQISQPHPRIIRIALIRTAYLLAFGQFGYGFAINPALNYVRNLFIEPENENLYPHGVMFNFPISDEHLGVSIITDPVEMRAYLVVFDILDRKKPIDRVGVVLPGWTENPIDLYNYLKSIDGNQVQLSTQKIADKIDFVKDFPLAALYHWNTLFNR